MILRALSTAHSPAARDVEPAAHVFIELEKQTGPPCAIIFQAEHSNLAGELAKGLDYDAFGEFPVEVIQAAAEHDFGWAESDEQQMQSLGKKPPRPFPRLSVEETLPSWRESLDHARSISPLVYVLVSRHFTNLGAQDPGREEFVYKETARRTAVESEQGFPNEDLRRWAGAVGFCDLLSLYLCSGSRHAVEFPLAHPADAAAEYARKVTLRWVDGSPQFSSPVIRQGTHVSLDVRRYDGVGREVTPLQLDWTFS